MGNYEKNKIYPNIYSCIFLFCTAALFETAFLGLTIQVWNVQGVIVYLCLIFILQFVACFKAICIWHIHRYRYKSITCTVCAVISGLTVYSAIEVFNGLVGLLTPAVPISLDSDLIALIDAVLSGVLLYGFKNWLTLLRNSDIPRLSSQIRHHFLFNTLNTTVCRIKENPQLAQDNLERLANLLRKILFLNIYISLEEELALVRCYLGIEKYRLGERLRISWLLNYETDIAIKVPALILQPLVENAIYHGIEKIVGGGTIVISLYIVGSRLVIEVCNPISNTGCADLAHRNRIAQTNIERRLALVYGDDFSFKREQCETEYRTIINIPKGGLRDECHDSRR